MIINVQNGKDVITLDFKLNQIRYCVDLRKHGKIKFYDMGGTTMDCYFYLYKNSRKIFFNSLAEDMESYTGVTIKPTDLKVITDQEYLEMLK